MTKVLLGHKCCDWDLLVREDGDNPNFGTVAAAFDKGFIYPVKTIGHRFIDEEHIWNTDAVFGWCSDNVEYPYSIYRTHSVRDRDGAFEVRPVFFLFSYDRDAVKFLDAFAFADLASEDEVEQWEEWAGLRA